jgi:hypothetical protein
VRFMTYTETMTAALFITFLVIGRFKTSQLWALQNQPGYKGIFHPLFPTLLLRWAAHNRFLALLVGAAD